MLLGRRADATTVALSQTEQNTLLICGRVAQGVKEDLGKNGSKKGQDEAFLLPKLKSLQANLVVRLTVIASSLLRKFQKSSQS